MAERYFIGDYHFGHDNMIKWRPQFRDEQDMYDYSIERYHNVVTKRDVVCFMGDIALTKKRLNDLKSWTAEKKILILGNHDLERDKIKIHDLLDVFDEVHGALKKNNMWLTHIPIHPKELRGKVNVSGHLHSNTLDDHRYFNASFENVDGTPISIQNVRIRMENRKQQYVKKITSNLEPFRDVRNAFKNNNNHVNNEDVVKALHALEYKGDFHIFHHNGTGIGTNTIIYDSNMNPIADITDYNTW